MEWPNEIELSGGPEATDLAQLVPHQHGQKLLRVDAVALVTALASVDLDAGRVDDVVLHVDGLQETVQPRMFTTDEAVKLGLVDQVKTLEQTIDELRQGQQRAGRERTARAKAISMTMASQA